MRLLYQVHLLIVHRLYYPGGHSEPLIYRPSAFTALTDPGVITPGTLYRVPADQVTAHYGVTATFTLPDHPATPLWTGPVPAVGSLPPGLQLAYPLQAAWSGAVFLPADGPISLQAPDFPAVVTTTVAGQVQPLGALFQAEAGWLPFSVQTQLTSAPLHLLLQQGGAPPHEIAPAYLWPQPPDRGLAVFVQGVTGVSRRIDPFVGAALSGTYPNSRPGELPPQDAQALVALPLSPSGSPIQVGIGQITWAGEVLTEAGIYTLELHTDAQVRLVLDDQVVLEPCSPIVEQWRRAQVSLTAGPHHVQLDFAPPSGTRGLEWLWTRPDGVREVVPPSRLRYRSAAQDALPPAPVPADLSVCTKPPPGPPTALHPQAILAADTGLQEPHGIAVDAAGQIYVADTDHHRVVHLDPAGKVLGFWGTAPTTSTTGLPGSFNRVNDLAVTRTGNPVTLDGATGDVQEFTPTGALQLRLPAVTSSSVGIAVGPDGRIWLADTAGSRLVRLTADGHPDAIVTGGAGNPLNQPIDVALAPDGTPYVVDILRRIVRLDSQGQVTQAWPVEIGFNGSGSHLAFWRGQVVWTDPDRHRLGLLDPGTGAVRYVGQAGSAPGEFRLPLGLAIGPNDNLYVLDSGNARIQVFSTLAAP